MRFLFILIISLSFLACDKNEKKDFYQSKDSVKKEVSISSAEAKKIMENKCYLCHNPTASEKNRIGPPMAAIKARYLKDATSKEGFVENIWHFVEKPTKEKAKLKGAVKRFGVMPYQKYNEAEIKAIASYMYDYKIDEPSWFKAHWGEKHGGDYNQQGEEFSSVNTQKSIEEIGLSYANSSKAQLGKNLMGAIQQQGVLYALEFCNVQAMPITDSMAKVHQTKIARVSNKNRNPTNKANAEEARYISLFQGLINKGEEPQPIVVSENEKNHFYYPIVTNDMCLKCHGNLGQEVEEKTYEKILELYPNDKAIGYNVNEVRGIWSIEFEKNESK